MTDTTKYASVALKHETKKKLEVVASSIIDLDLSLAQTITFMTDHYYKMVTSPYYVKPLRGSPEYQEKKKQWLNLNEVPAIQASSEKL
jgi:hypothetical protein